MVLKLSEAAMSTQLRFENDVKMYGTQAKVTKDDVKK